MHLFVIVAALVVVMHLVAAAQRPRLAIIVSAVLWLLYAIYEYLVATRVLCDADCNIRVDLVFFIPILALATFCAYQAYNGRPGQFRIIGTVLGVVGVIVLGLVLEGMGYGFLGSAVVGGVLAVWLVYAVKSKSVTKRS